MRGRLPEIVKAAIVHALACYDPPTVVAAFIKAEYDVTVSPQLAESYNPERFAGRELAQKWRDMFAATRKQYVADQATIGIAHKSVRLRRIQQIADRHQGKNDDMALRALEQAAKETGDAFTNRREHSGPGGGPIMTETIDKPPNETREEWLARKAKERGETT